MVYLLLICKMLVSSGMGGLASFSAITLLSTNNQNYKISFIYALGIGPALASLLLYYLLLLLPGYTSPTYLAIIFLIYTTLIVINPKSINVFVKTFSSILKSGSLVFKLNTGVKNYFFNTNNIFIGILFIVFAVGVKNILLTQMPGHDVLEYMVQGEYLFEDKAIEYVPHRYYPTTGFYYVGLHGWSFPLQVTLEKMVDNITFFGFDLYFKSLTLWYGVLLLTIVYTLSKKYMDVLYALSIISILCLAKGYLTSIIFFHIDSYRMFFFCLSFLFTLQQINKPNFKSLPVLAFVAGTSGFSHSLGVIIAIILGAGLLLYIPKNWRYKIKYLLTYTFLVLLFGGIHYVIDVFYGTGWIFKEIDFY